MMNDDMAAWLLHADEPWTRYRTLVDLLNRKGDDADVREARAQMLAHAQVQELVAKAATWPGYALTRHNDPKHPIYALSTLADLGIQYDDPGMAEGVRAVMRHQSEEGALLSTIRIAKAFGGTDEDMWTWVACDAPTLLYALLAMGLRQDPRVQRAIDHLVGLADENGWRCVASPGVGKFRGPGKRSDPCPIANVYALKALSQVPELLDHPAMHRGAEMLLTHWQERGEKKYYLFGIGTDFCRLKYPFIWYDILHVVEVLSRFPFVHPDARFHEMLDTITAQADAEGRYTATSMYLPWKGWSFADKKRPSPWLTFLVLRIQERVAG